jgi:hypothetical protein
VDSAMTAFTRRSLEKGVNFGEPFSKIMVLSMMVVDVLLHP